MNYIHSDSIHNSGNPNTAVLQYSKKCEPITKKYLGSTGRNVLTLAAFKEMSAELSDCVDRQPHSKPTLSNSKGGFGSWIPNVFRLGNSNEGK